MDYEYTPLSGPASTRIIRLCGTTDHNSPIHCSLLEISLEGPAKYEYDALSYTWGGQDRNVTITCEGKRLYVTPNCYAALRRLRGRRRKDISWLWVDAICIDQSSTKERNAQVSIMGNIYSRADCVLMWLGSSTTVESQDAARHLAKLYRSLNARGEAFLLKIRSEWVKQRLRWILHKCARFELSWYIINDLEERPYWQRAWTLQEVALSRSPFVLYGPEIIPYAKLAFGLMVDKRCHLSDKSPVYNHCNLGATVHGVDTDSVYGTRECCLRVALAVHATDPRDKVFALRSIFPNTLGHVAVDYNATIEDIYIEAARCVILHEQNPFNMLELLQPSLKRPNLPSWVPDLSLTLATIPVIRTTFMEVLNSGSRPLMKGQNLMIQGYKIDTIEFCGDAFPQILVRPGDSMPDVPKRWGTIYTQANIQSIKVLRHWCQIMNDYYLLYRPTDRKESTTTLISMLMQRLLFNRGAESPLIQGNEETLKRAVDLFFRFITVGTDKVNPDSYSIDELESFITRNEPYPWQQDKSIIDPFSLVQCSNPVQPNSLEAKILIGTLLVDTLDTLHSQLHIQFQNSRFFITRKGRFGFADATVEPGDIIALFAGGRVPYVVAANRGGRYLKGFAFLNGAMGGEDWPRDESLLQDFVLN